MIAYKVVNSMGFPGEAHHSTPKSAIAMGRNMVAYPKDKVVKAPGDTKLLVFEKFTQAYSFLLNMTWSYEDHKVWDADVGGDIFYPPYLLRYSAEMRKDTLNAFWRTLDKDSSLVDLAGFMGIGVVVPPEGTLAVDWVRLKELSV